MAKRLILELKRQLKAVEIAIANRRLGTDTLRRDREETELHCFGAIGSGVILHCQSPQTFHGFLKREPVLVLALNAAGFRHRI